MNVAFKQEVKVNVCDRHLLLLENSKMFFGLMMKKVIKSAHVLFFYPILSSRSGWIKSIYIKGDGKEIHFIYDGMYIINSETNMFYVLSGNSAENIPKYIE